MLALSCMAIAYALGTVLAAIAMDWYTSLETRRALYAAYYGLNPYWYFRK